MKAFTNITISTSTRLSPTSIDFLYRNFGFTPFVSEKSFSINEMDDELVAL